MQWIIFEYYELWLVYIIIQDYKYIKSIITVNVKYYVNVNILMFQFIINLLRLLLIPKTLLN